MTSNDAIQKIKTALYMVHEVESCEIERHTDYYLGPNKYGETGMEVIDIKIRFKRADPA